MAEEQHAPPGAIYDPGEVGRAGHNLGDRFVVVVSNACAWLFPILVVAICSQVVLRASGNNQAWLDDLQWWLYGVSALVGIGYAVTTDSHVRIDIFHNRFPERRKQWIEVLALTWLLLPFVILAWDLTLQYAIVSVMADEASDSPNGLHNLWILKVLVNVSFLFVGVAVWASYVRHLGRVARPTLFRQLVVALPSTLFGFNVAVHWIVLVFLKLTRFDPETGEALTLRDLQRLPVFDSLALGHWEVKITMLITLATVAAALLASGLWSLRRRG